MLTMRRVTKATELKRFKELEGEYHYMGETHSGGDTMRLVFEEDGKWVALMVWGSACYHLKPRDAYVGWANSIRAERLKLVVNNRVGFNSNIYLCHNLSSNICNTLYHHRVAPSTAIRTQHSSLPKC